MPPQLGLLNGFAAGLTSIANFVRDRMPEVSTDVFDLSSCSLLEAKQELGRSLCHRHEGKLFIGITTTTASYQSALQLASFAKQMLPSSIIVFGGHHASADTRNILEAHHDIVDVIIFGEGERSICELLRQHPFLSGVPGLAYIRDGHLVTTHPPNPLTQDELDSIPISYGEKGLIGTPGKFDHVTYVSARGCPLRCAFCAVGNERIRAKSIDAVIRDIETLLDMGYSRIAIEDNFFAHAPSRTTQVCEALAAIKRRRNGVFAWDCQTRVESLARDNTIRLMADGGCEAVYIGVESLIPKHLTYLKKTTHPAKYLRTLLDVVVPALLETTINCYINLQFGLPGETVDDERLTFDLLAAMGKLAVARTKRITVFPQLHVVYPGTAHFEHGVAQMRFPKTVFESFTEWEFTQVPVLFWLGEHFAHGTGGIPEGILQASLLKRGVYVVDTDAVFRISAVLRAIDRIPGVSTFNYGDFIVSTAHVVEETSAAATAPRRVRSIR